MRKGLEASMTMWVALMAVVFFVVFAGFMLFSHATQEGIQNLLGSEQQQSVTFGVQIGREASARDTSNLPHYVVNVMRNQNLTQERFQNAITCETTTEESVEQNKWYHVAATYSNENDEMRIYIDGTLAAIGSAEGSIVTGNGATMSIGGEIIQPDDFGEDPYVLSSFNGFLDELNIYDTALSSQQIEDVINGRDIDPTPIANWTLDEGSGQQVGDATSTGFWEPDTQGVLGMDTSDNEHDPAWRSGSECKSGACLHFDGNDDVVEIAESGYGGSDALTMMGWVKPETETVAFGYTFAGSGHIIGKAGGEDVHRIYLQSSGDFEFFTRTYDANAFEFQANTITAPPDTCGFSGVQLKFRRAVRNLMGTRTYRVTVTYQGEEVINIESGDQTFDTGPAEYITQIPMPGQTTAQLHIVVEGNDLKMRWRR